MTYLTVRLLALALGAVALALVSGRALREHLTDVHLSLLDADDSEAVMAPMAAWQDG